MKKNFKGYIKNVVVPCFVYGALTGLCVGTAVFFFKLGAEFLVEKSTEIYAAVAAHPVWVPLLFAALVLMAVAMHFLHRWASESKGGGIPRAEGVLRGLLTFRWLRTAIAVVVNSFLSFFGGLPLGSEGPSVLLGTAIGDGASKLPLSHDSWRKYIMTGGASAGFAVATNAPLTGVIFALEETHRRFTPMILLMALSTVLFAYGTSLGWGMILGHPAKPLFSFPTLSHMALSDVWTVALLGVGIGLLAALFNLLVHGWGRLWKKFSKVPEMVRIILAFVLTGAIGLLLPQFIGGGAGLIVSVSDYQTPFRIIVLLLAVKFIMIPLCTGTGATGGLFIPMLCVGALAGGAFGKVFVAMGMDSSLYPSIVLFGMAAFMSAGTHAPLTALVFVLECTWQFDNLYYVGITVFLSYFICEILKVDPLYEALLDTMQEQQNEGKKRIVRTAAFRVEQGSFVSGKTVRDVLWPANTVVSRVYGHEKDSIEDGARRLFADDTVVVLMDTYDEAATVAELLQLTGSSAELPVPDAS